LSKKFESNFRGSLEEAVHFFEEHPPKGEFVIVVEGTKNK
jgi:16S rRNA (cytidine1402-2'-O)-methyltransferase